MLENVVEPNEETGYLGIHTTAGKSSSVVLGVLKSSGTKGERRFAIEFMVLVAAARYEEPSVGVDE